MTDDFIKTIFCPPTFEKIYANRGFQASIICLHYPGLTAWAMR